MHVFYLERFHKGSGGRDSGHGFEIQAPPSFVLGVLSLPGKACFLSWELLWFRTGAGWSYGQHDRHGQLPTE